MARAAHPPGCSRRGGAGDPALRGDPPAQPNRRGHSGAQRRLGPPRILPRHGVAGRRRAAGVGPREAVHEAGEHRHTDLRHCLRWPRLQRYAAV
jgi:hypothetical protein